MRVQGAGLRFEDRDEVHSKGRKKANQVLQISAKIGVKFLYIFFKYVLQRTPPEQIHNKQAFHVSPARVLEGGANS